MKTKIISLLILFSFFYSCKNSYDGSTKLFITYLEENFHQKIENEIYVLMPLNLCGSCVEKMILKINNVNNNNNITVILVDYTSVTFSEPKSKLKGVKILLDNKMNIVKRNIISGGAIVLFQVENNRIEKIIEYLPEVNEKEIESVLIE